MHFTRTFGASSAASASVNSSTAPFAHRNRRVRRKALPDCNGREQDNAGTIMNEGHLPHLPGQHVRLWAVPAEGTVLFQHAG